MCGGEWTAMCGEPRVAAECTCTEREFGRCSRPTVRPGRNVNDDRDHGDGDGSSTRPRGRRTSGSLTETRVRDWQYLAGTVRRVGGPDHEPMPAGRDRPTGQARPRRVHRAKRTGRRRWRSGPCHRRCAPPGLPARWRGGTAVGRGHRGARATAATPPVLVAPSPAIAAPESLAACRCRCRRPRTVCVVPRERGGGTGGVSRERTRPGNGDPMSASGPPSVRW